MRFKERPEDFKVEEVLSRPLLREGEHRVYRLEKAGIETEEALKEISKLSRVSLKKISYGGRKDKNARTVQFISVPRNLKLKEIERKNLSLKEWGFSDKPVKEYVEGNRFEIFVRGVGEVPKDRAEILREIGIPNYYGEQRFISSREGKVFAQLLKDKEKALLLLFRPASFEGSRERKGKKAFLRGEYEEASKLLRGWRRRVAEFMRRGGKLRKAFRLIPKGEVEFQMNVLQSLLFNERLKEIVRESGVRALKLKYRMGELLYPTEKIEMPLELPSYRPFSAEYRDVVEKLGIDEETLKPYAHLFHNFKRKTLIKPQDLTIEERDGGVLLRFKLPKGSYATNVLRFLFNAV